MAKTQKHHAKSAERKERERLSMLVEPPWMDRLDRWRIKQGVPIINRSEAVRRIGTEIFDRDLIES